MSAGIEPCHAASQQFDVQCIAFQVGTVDVGNFEFTTCRWLDVGGDVAHIGVVEIQAGDRIIGFRGQRLFLDADCTPVVVELYDAVTLRIGDVIGKYGRPVPVQIGSAQL